jgi:hypothetical protein
MHIFMQHSYAPARHLVVSLILLRLCDNQRGRWVRRQPSSWLTGLNRQRQTPAADTSNVMNTYVLSYPCPSTHDETLYY